MKNFSIITAIDQNMGISRDGELPWYLPEDVKYFSQVTKTTEYPGQRNALLMDLNAWESLPDEVKPFSERINGVIYAAEELELPEGVLQFESLDEALSALSTSEQIDNVFVIGGAALYQEAVLHPDLERIFLTKLEDDYDCDSFFPDQIPEDFEVISATEILEDDGIEYSFVILERTTDSEKDDEENQNDDLPEEEENENL